MTGWKETNKMPLKGGRNRAVQLERLLVEGKYLAIMGSIETKPWDNRIDI